MILARERRQLFPVLLLGLGLPLACAGGAGAPSTTVESAGAGTGAAGPRPPGAEQTSFRLDTARMLSDLRTLAADSFMGRRVGTPGGAMARAYVARAMAASGARALGDDYVLPFTFAGGRGGSGSPIEGGNVVGVVRGSRRPARYLVVSSHFDHVGVRSPVTGDSIYNGADDNASGTAAVLELARWFAIHPPENSILFIAFDAEESGLRGARELVASPPVPLDSVVVNVNMDMVSRNEKGELYAVGTLEYPVLLPYVRRAQERRRVTLLTGHEGPAATGSDNWTAASDHGAFRAAGIPYLYFGVEDHPGYHQPSDEAAAITPGFYARAVETVLDVVLDLDRNLEPVAAARRR